MPRARHNPGPPSPRRRLLQSNNTSRVFHLTGSAGTMSEIKTITAVLLPFAALVLVGGCAARQHAIARNRPNVSPSTQPAGESFRLDRSQIAPMYREMLAIDLSTVVSVAAAQNIDIREARQ